MEHLYQFQHWLFFIGLLSLALSVKANGFKGSNDGRSINENRTALPRKLLLSPDTFSDIGDGTNRIGQDCSKDDIVLFQGSTNPLPSGVPSYTVEIFNSCVSDCNIAEIHVSCGWFSSVRLVNPRVFRRLDYDDCLVNDGQPLGPGQTLSFQYANSFSYPLSVASVSCF
ncbi:TPD1 protein homolog 1 isoform X1 [Arabidopsis lyrata subsp. lyrata]|uniref:TPD1 protein homolog 1 isoform X1 n=1 Tax=Arabidopsis lyrata subsp. lyrata TaxID=81972 RepID=UPI000A29B1BA|nr:TPD1 protein homolog 1 isoform X1 [Arabidopsis lyrata subsp. lyrata]|eukprot:XP_020869942.1 TPD1 protein homolog 1 isoform X1 [Arabidopsis lyrata subsp. lyrata]